MLREIVPFFFVLRSYLIKITILATGLVSVLWISGGIYGSFYYAYIPLQTYRLPLNFAFDPCPIQDSKERCSFLKASVNFNPIIDLSPDLAYSISLDLQLPSDETNRQVGMFMTCLSLNKETGVRFCQSAVLPHRTSLSRSLRSLIPWSNYGGEEFINVHFLDQFKDKYSEDPLQQVHVEIQSRLLSVDHAWLRLHPEFNGLRYVMYHYPMSFGVFGITFVSIILISLLFLLLGQILQPKQVSDFDKKPTHNKKLMTERLEKCPQFGKLVEKVEKKRVNLHED